MWSTKPETLARPPRWPFYILKLHWRPILCTANVCFRPFASPTEDYTATSLFAASASPRVTPLFKIINNGGQCFVSQRWVIRTDACDTLQRDVSCFVVCRSISAFVASRHQHNQTSTSATIDLFVVTRDGDVLRQLRHAASSVFASRVVPRDSASFDFP